MIERHETDRALNQLMCLVTGKDLSRSTYEYRSNPLARLKAMRNILLQKQMSPDVQQDWEEARADNTKMDAINSLQCLATALDEVDWDAEPLPAPVIEYQQQLHH